MTTLLLLEVDKSKILATFMFLIMWPHVFFLPVKLCTGSFLRLLCYFHFLPEHSFKVKSFRWVGKGWCVAAQVILEHLSKRLDLVVSNNGTAVWDLGFQKN